MADDSSKPPHPGALPGNVPLPRPASGDERRRLLDEQAAALEAQIRQACQPQPPSPVPGNKLGARKDARFMAICTAPSINWTPAGAGKVPVPYQTVQDLSNSMSTARTVRFNGLPAYLLDQTTQPKGMGDERGTGKGIRSGTVGGEVRPVSGCKTVRIEGKLVVREGDKCTMNGGNNPGIYVATAHASTSPTFTQTLFNEVKAAVEDPVSGITGAIKGFLNSVPDIAEMLITGTAAQQANDLEERGHLLKMLGQKREAEKLALLADASREASDSIAIPKLPLNGAAERGGSNAAVAFEMASTGVGLFRVTKSLFRKIPKPTKKAAIPPSTPSGNGLRISGNTSIKKTAAERSAAFQGKEPYPNTDSLKNIELSSGKRVVQITFSMEGRPISEYFTTESAIRRSTLSNGSVDANRLNQGLQIYASIDPQTGLQRPDFKKYIQYYELTENIPIGETAFGRTKAHPIYNPDEYPNLPQLFINSEQHNKLRPLNLKEMSNTRTPTYEKP